MNVINEKNLRKKIRQSLRTCLSEEDIRSYESSMDYGIYDQPINRLEVGDIDNDKSISKKETGPSPEASLQLTQDYPDVNDPKFVPTSTKELQLAMYVLSKSVPDEQIKNFYRDVSALVIKSIDKNQESLDQVSEARDLPHSIQKEKTIPGNFTLQQTADATGIGSVAKMDQFENRLLKKMRALLVTSKAPEIENLLDASLDAYISVMKDAGAMSDDDVQFFRNNSSRKEQLKKSDLFRSFLGNAILQQGMRKIRLGVEKTIKASLDKIELPPGADLTILNYVMENTNMTYQKFLNLIGQKSSKSSWDVEKMYNLSKTLPRIVSDLRAKIESESNVKLIPSALKAWVDSSNNQKIKLLKKSAQELSDMHTIENEI